MSDFEISTLKITYCYFNGGIPPHTDQQSWTELNEILFGLSLWGLRDDLEGFANST